MKFSFRLETVMKQRKVEQDLAQKDYQLAQADLNSQLTYIKELYSESDQARSEAAQRQGKGGEQIPALNQIDEFINLQKVKIQKEREKARALMQVAEEKHEVLVDKSKNLKALEKLKDKQYEEFKKEYLKKETKDNDDITVMRQRIKR